jgi:hypothetical protein
LAVLLSGKKSNQINMKKAILCFIALLLLRVPVNAQALTFSQHIAPIIYNNCTNCHRAGEIGPFPLTNYNEVAQWASMLKYVTSIKYMPPWKADPDYQKYQKERFLTDLQIQQIAAWVDSGALQGDPNLEPPLPVFPTGSQVGIPDKVVSFSQSYTHKGTGVDEYRYFVLPTGLTQDMDLIAAEVRPGNTKVLHHVLMWQDTTGDAAAEDAATPEYGYEGGSGMSASLLNGQLPGYVPGQRPVVLNNGMAQELKANADLRLQVHYAPTSSDETDSTSINLFFAKTPATRYVQTKILVPLPGVLVNGPFIIQANKVKEFHGTWTVPEDASFLSIAPHCHKLGKHWKVYAIKPNGDTVPLINIKDWDFNWQGSFAFKNLIHLPQNSVIHAFAEYDNTINNPLNPNNPPQNISWGENTSDEMYYLPMSYITYQQGDENLILEATPTGISNPQFYSIKNQLYPVAPNPATDKLSIGFTLAESGKVYLRIYNNSGQQVATVLNEIYHMPGLHTVNFFATELSSGIYNVVMDVNTTHQTQKLVITK